MFSKEEVRNIAKLARLEISEEEIEKYQKELSSILDYVEKLKEVDVSAIEPTSHSVLMENVMRQDGEKERARTERESLLALAPETKEGYLKVRAIL